MNPRWSPHEVQTLRDMWPRDAWGDIRAALPGRSVQSIRKKAKQYGLRRAPDVRYHARSASNPIFRQLRGLRLAHGIGRNELARKMGYGSQHFARIENGTGPASLFAFFCWLDALDVELRLIPRTAGKVKTTKPEDIRRPTLSQLMAGRAA